jgi:hypothetical protein
MIQELNDATLSWAPANRAADPVASVAGQSAVGHIPTAHFEFRPGSPLPIP